MTSIFPSNPTAKQVLFGSYSTPPSNNIVDAAYYQSSGCIPITLELSLGLLYVSLLSQNEMYILDEWSLAREPEKYSR